MVGATNDQRGLLGLARARDGRLFASWTESSGRLLVGAVTPDTHPPRIIWSGPPSADRANGGTLAIDRDGRLLIGIGDLLGERGIEVDHVTIYRWVQRFTPLLADAAGPCRHTVGDRWYVDETYVKVAGRWRYVYRAVDQHGQIIDVLVSARRDLRAARRFFSGALRAHGEPVEVVTDRAPALRAAIEGLIPAAFHNTDQYANNRVECDHGRLKARLRPMHGLKRDYTARVIMRGHALMQNIRRGHYEVGVDARHHGRIEAAFTELAQTI